MDKVNNKTLHLQPITYAEACQFIAEHHRHHLPPQGWKFGVAINDGSKVVGVLTVGRPVSRHLDDGYTLEVTRCCVVDNVKNGCSKLYAAAWRAAKALVTKCLITYTLINEQGTSLRAAGYKQLYITKGGSWNRNARPRVDKAPTLQKRLWLIGETPCNTKHD